MIASMFNLEHRLADLRPTEQELETERRLRQAAAPATRPNRSAGEPTRSWFSGSNVGSRLSPPTAF
jgi:hypothetical protein